MEELLYGRQVLEKELPLDYFKEVDQEKVEKLSGFIEKGNKWFCRRCGSAVEALEPSFCLCGQSCGYCTECIQMSKVKRCSTFYHLKETNKFPKFNQPLKWEGKLSAQQALAADDIIHSIKHKETRLIWAVAGAGKTEMLFKGIQLALEEGLRIALASPRVDVCLELYPRIQAAFPKVGISLLYGGQEEPYQYQPLTIATTHQLFRFKEAFDLLIIDEIDAFPFDVDRTLQHAANQSRKQVSALIYLSATPNHKMQKMIKRRKLLATILPARYHGFPLPVPVAKSSPKWETELLAGKSTNNIFKHMDQLLKAKKKFLVFIPNIKWCMEWEQLLKSKYQKHNFQCVHSKDPNRKEKVLEMRNGELDFLVTTTILERGVTFINIDVIVVGACDRIFTEASLVQISGRAGRSPQFPKGQVTFYYKEVSLPMKRAIKQIKSMNKQARKRGLLND